jgi:hypothetical protein
MTQAEIQLLIDQIVTNANYRANQLNPLLTDMLTASYGPMYIDAFPPTPNDDETGGYRPGSIAYDTASQRFYICKNPAAGAAEWQLIPVDANYEYKSYESESDTISLGQNTSVFKAYNMNTVVNIKCSVLLPENPYTGKVVILYFQDPMEQFNIEDSEGTPISAGESITIAGGQQYTITYGGVQWEIVGVSNISPAEVTGVAVSKGATVVNDATFINFIGSSVTVAPSSTGADVTINPASGVDVQRGGTLRKASAQFINFNSYFFDVDPNTTGADITFVQRITAKRDNVNRSTAATGFDFAGTLFDSVVMVDTYTATITMNGAKTLTLSGAIAPAVTDDASDGYSRGSVAVNTGTLKRTYICTSNTTDAANWVRLTEDNGYQVQTASSSGQNYSLLKDTSTYLIIGSSVLSMTLTLPSNQYNGKKIFISVQVGINGLVVNNSNGSTVMLSQSIGGTTLAPKLLIFVCVDSSAQTWARVQ